jgi:hypothetical protein
MSTFFGNLSEIAREVVFVPTVHFDTGLLTYVQTLTARQWMNGSLGVFRTQLKVSFFLFTQRNFNFQDFLDFSPNIRKRFESVKCPRCLKIDYINVWCRRNEEVSQCFWIVS